MRARLLVTKFHIPPRRPGSVARERLLEELHRGLDENHKLALICAPAGYGKTILAAEWVASFQSSNADRVPKISWFSIDETDNDPARFLDYLIAMLQRVDESLGQRALSLMGIPQVATPLVILDELLNDVAGLEINLCLVLDDYHIITSPQIHQMLEYLLDHQPPQLFLLVITRVDPPLPLARLRARGQMTELRARDLRFTLEEADQFFNLGMRLNLSREAIRTLDARTEGWAVGLHLAALALHDQTDPGSFLSDFGGSHRYVVDYLLEEVLKRQPPEFKAFLTQTAILKRFNAALCRAVTGNPGAAEIIAQLERANLFLLPLDDSRGWYRYHTLFAEVLCLELDPTDERVLNTRAAIWFEENGWLIESVSHWLNVPEPSQAARLIAQLAPELLRTGEAQTLLGWLNALPEDILVQSPELISHHVLCLMMTGQPDAARASAAHAFASSPLGKDGRMQAVQAWFAAAAGSAETIRLASLALESLGEGDSFFHALALLALGGQYAWRSNLVESSQVFRQTWDLGRRMQHPFIALGGLANLAFNLLEMGQLREAEALCRSAFCEYVDSRGRPLPVLGILYAPLAALCYEKGNLDEAQNLAEQGIALCLRLFSNDIMGGDNEITLARICLERGEPEKGFDLLRGIAHSASRRGMSIVVYKMALAEADLLFLIGDLSAVERKLHEVDSLNRPELAKSSWMAEHLRARFLAAMGDTGQALEILNTLLITSRSDGALRRRMGVQLTQALVYEQMGDRSRARVLFKETVKLAVPEGYRSLFFSYPGRPTRPLLEALRSNFPEFVGDILKENLTQVKTGSAPFAQLADPLSEQEMRVLALIMDGRSNAEIASSLVVSVGTAKWHVHNILQKLGVSNRPQAIARARELGF
jgi:LuxR family maltose regulon positive regulatory protein